jgi:RHS repeat-associated protein
LGRQLSEGSTWFGTRSSQYDAAGRRTRLTWHDGFYVTYDHNILGEITAVKEGGATTLASYGYDDLGRRTSLTRGNGAVTSYGYDGVSRLASLTQDAAGSIHDLSLTFGYNPAGQIVSNTRSNDAYAYDALTNQTRTDTHNGLNQIAATGAAAIAHDVRGNITSDGAGRTISYSVQNWMAFVNGMELGYHILGELGYLQASNTIIDYDFATGQAIDERENGGPLRRRYVPGAGVDEPVVWYEGSGTSDRRYLHADERGSVIAVSDGTGAVTAINRYDEYGTPASNNVGRFQYTGQMWLPEAGLYYYKARMYDPKLRFMQPDPIGYGDGLNRYAYVSGDPVNLTDPLGLRKSRAELPVDILVTGERPRAVAGGGGGGRAALMTARPRGPRAGEGEEEIIVTGTRPNLEDGEIVVVARPLPAMPRRIKIASGPRSGRGSNQNVRQTWLEGVSDDDLREMERTERDPNRRRAIRQEQKARGLRNQQIRGRGGRGPGIRMCIICWFFPIPLFVCNPYISDDPECLVA